MEYKVEQDVFIPHLEAELNALSAEGWVVTALIPDDKSHTMTQRITVVLQRGE